MPFSLIPRHLLAHPVRSALTLASIVVAVFLVAILRSTVVGLTAGVEAAASNRLIVQSAVSLFVSLPRSYQSRIEGAPGAATVIKQQWFGAVYGERENFFPQFAVDADLLFDCYPEIRLLEGDRETFVANRTSCLIGWKLAERFGFAVGDAIPLVTSIFPRADGRPWEMTVAGIFDSDSAYADESTLFFHFEYLAESLEAGTALGPSGVGVYVIRLAPGASPTEVMRRVDALFENGPQRVQTTTEAEFARQFVTMLGNVPVFLGSIGAGVLFAIFLAALNTMLMAGRERTRDLGILKALGFTDGALARLLLVESVLLCTAGGVLGALLALAAEPVMAETFQSALPGFTIDSATIAFGIGLAAAVGAAAGIAPAWQARRLVAVDALKAV